MHVRIALLCIAVLTAAGGTAVAASLTVPGNPQAGRDLIKTFGCGSCHSIPGVDGADALVGPPLLSWRDRIYIAGMLRNTPDNLRVWIQHPQQVVPGNAMPDMGISAKQAQDIAAYLFTLY